MIVLGTGGSHPDVTLSVSEDGGGSPEIIVDASDAAASQTDLVENFSYYLTDDGYRSNTATATVCIWPSGNSDPQPTPLPPVNAQAYVDYTSMNQPLSYSFNRLLQNASAFAGTPKMAGDSITTNGGGTITIGGDGSFTYTPATDFVGVDTFQYGVKDSVTGLVANFVGMITVGDDPPVAGPSTYSALPGQTITIPGSAFAGSDEDGNALAEPTVNDPVHGSLEENGDGSYSYTAPSDWTGTDYITYTVSDGAYTSNVGTVNITVPSIHLRLLWNGTNNDPANDADGSGEQLYLEGDSTSPPSSGLEELQLSASPGFTSYPAGTVFTLTESGDGQADVWSSTNSGATKLLDADNPSTSWTPSCDSNGDWGDLPPNDVWVDATGAGSMQFVLGATLPSGGGGGEEDAVLGLRSFGDDATTNPTTAASPPAKATISSIEILYDGKLVDPEAPIKILIGQQVNLQVRLLGDLTGRLAWTVEGSVFKNYETNTQKGVFVPLQEPLTGVEITYYYSAGSGDGTDSTFVSMGGDSAYVQFKVEAPETTLTAEMGTPGIIYRQNDWNLALAGLGDNHQTGIFFTGGLQMPADFQSTPGKWGIIWTVRGYQYQWNWTPGQLPGPATFQHESSNGQLLLDTYFPNSYNHPLNEPTPVGEPLKQASYDAPGLPLHWRYWVRDTQTFYTYMLFLPPGKSSVYVPVRELTWWWDAGATVNRQKGWKDDFGNIDWAFCGSDPSVSVAPIAPMTSPFPVWDANIKDQKWEGGL